MAPPSEASNERIRTMRFSSVYPLYLAMAQKKGRTAEEVHEILHWLTGYDVKALAAQGTIKEEQLKGRL